MDFKAIIGKTIWLQDDAENGVGDGTYPQFFRLSASEVSSSGRR
jgi:hypothetical protein